MLEYGRVEKAPVLAQRVRVPKVAGQNKKAYGEI